MTSKISKSDKDKLYNVVAQLNLMTNWEKNADHIATLWQEMIPDMELAAYWAQTGEALYLTKEAQRNFEPYVQSLKRGDVVQSKQLRAVPGFEQCYSLSLKMGAAFLGLLLVHLKGDLLKDNEPTSLAEQYVQLLLPQLTLARYASEMADEVEKRTSSDKLTGLWKRTYFNERFREESERLSRSKEVGSVAIMGLDDLAAMVRMLPVEEHNHLLTTAGRSLRALLRQTDWTVRWDNYEILFYFPNTSPESALEVFSRCIKSLIQINPILQPLVGLCSTAETTSARGLIQLAARRLDLARKDGRHKLVCFATRSTGLNFWEYGGQN